MRVSLKDLFVITGFAAVMAWCAGQARIDNSMFWAAVTAAALLSVVFVVIARKPARRGWTLLLAPGAFFFCMFPLGSGVMFYFVVLLLVAAIICTFTPRPGLSVRSLTGMMMACLMASFVYATFETKEELRRLEQLRRDHPVVSLASRLAYEQSLAQSRPAPVLGPSVTKSLDEFEQSLDDTWGYRVRGLEMLHDRQHELFVRASGFGIGRMPRPRVDWIERPALRDFTFDAPKEEIESDWYEEWEGARYTAAAEEPADMHRASRNDFLDVEGFGAVFRPLVEVAGFIEHAVHVPTSNFAAEELEWTVERLELVSLLKFDAPRVYVLNHLPRMDQLASDNVPTRGLDAFETAALARLHGDEDVVIEGDEQAMRMLGSLRAAKQCLDCHSVGRGELLGAFAYVLRPRVDGGSAELASVTGR